MHGQQNIKKYFTYVSEDFASSVFRVRVLKITFPPELSVTVNQMTWFHILVNLSHGQQCFENIKYCNFICHYLQNVYELCFVIFNSFCLIFLVHERERAKYFIIQGGADVT